MQGWLKAAVEWWKGEEPEAPLPEKPKWFETAAWWLRDRERQIPVTVRAAALESSEPMSYSDEEITPKSERDAVSDEFAQRCARVEEILRRLENA